MSQIIETLAEDPGIMLGAVLASLGIIAGTVICITAIVLESLRKMRFSEEINALKQTMLDRGMPADEIATVISATPAKRSSFIFNAGRAGMRSRC